MRAPGRLGGFGDGAGPLVVNGVERLLAGGGEDADRIDHDIGAFDGFRDGGRIAEIGLDRVDLADDAHRLQITGEVGTAGGGADAPAILGEGADRVASDKAGAAEDGNET